MDALCSDGGATGGFARESRDFTVLVVAPPDWPFERDAGEFKSIYGSRDQ